MAVMLLAAHVSGCGPWYGHDLAQTSIAVSTAPPHLHYYLFDIRAAQDVLDPVPDGWQIKANGDFAGALKPLLHGLLSDSSPLTYEAGTYVLAVLCPQGFRFQTVQLQNQSRNNVSFECQ